MIGIFRSSYLPELLYVSLYAFRIRAVTIQDLLPTYSSTQNLPGQTAEGVIPTQQVFFGLLEVLK